MATLADALAEIQALRARAAQLENQRQTDVVTATDLRNQIVGLQAGLAPLQALQAQLDLQGAAPVVAQAAAGGGRRVLPRITFNNGEKEDWLSFKESFLNIHRFQRYALDDSKWALKACMHGAALLAITDLNHEDNNETLEALLVRYEAKFMPPAASALARTRFEEAKQGSKESILAFHGRIGTLWARAYPGDAIGNLVIRKFMTGLRTLRMREFVQRANPATWDAALQAAQAEQAIVESNKVFSEDAMDISAMDLKNTKCHGCGRFGHLVSTCRFRPQIPPGNKGKTKGAGARKFWNSPADKKKSRAQQLLQELLSADNEENADEVDCILPDSSDEDDDAPSSPDAEEEEDDEPDSNQDF